ncbi:hypothetical protein U1872_08070 [Sphingomonas sp. RB3P16]|uniref:hypothetical protein n=1 Tax=Parasphingomonas frigoris TaxID=3096163 RepID=UPI002FC71A9D
MADEETISLYLDLEPDQRADIEVVARAALAWAATIREMAVHLDPMSELRVDLISGTEGSLSLNAVFRFVRSAVPTRKASKALLFGILLWLTEHGLEWTYDQILDAVKHRTVANGQEIAEEDAQDIARRVAVLLKPSIAEGPKRALFREVERDGAIRGVGASAQPGERPADIVPRADFKQRAGETVESSEDDRRRTVVSELDVILISPVLKDAERRWRFQHGGLPEFGATMKDHAFLEALNAGRLSVPMRPGVPMRIEVQSREELHGEIWEVTERAVSRVIEPSDRGQPSFALPTEQ